MRIALLLVAGCLSEPAKPHGVGPPLAPGSVLRELAVGDVNHDGYDDIIAVGNEGGRGIAPTLFVYFGGETLENPDVRAGLVLADSVQTDVWFETLNVAIFPRTDAGDDIAVLTGQDTEPEPPNGVTSVSRRTFLLAFSADGRTIVAGAHSGGVGGPLGGYADHPAHAFLVERTTTLAPKRELLYGEDIVNIYEPPLDPTQNPVDGSFDLTMYEGVGHYVQQLYALPPADGSRTNDMLAITTMHAFRTQGDGPLYAVTNGNASLGRQDDNHGRGRYERGHFHATAVFAQNPQLLLIDVDVAAGGDPAVYAAPPRASPSPTDAVLTDVGGSDAIDLVAIEHGVLVVHRDLALGAETTAAAEITSDDILDAYDRIAIGNFHGDGAREIYVIATQHAEELPRCYRLAGDGLVRCPDE
jgi:hypothetical protein